VPRHTASSSPWRVDTVKDDTIPGISSPSSKFSGWSARRAFGRVVSSRSHAAVAPIDVAVMKQQQSSHPYHCYAKQLSSCSFGSDRTTPSPPIALPLQLTERRHNNLMMLSTDRSSTLTDPVAVTLLAQEAAQQHQPSGRPDWFLVNHDEQRMQLQFWAAAPSPVHAQPPPHTVLSRPTAIRPMMTTKR
jgi:hypothetical protein